MVVTSSLLLAGCFLASLVLSLRLTFSVRRWAGQRGFVDVPDGARRIHAGPVPNVGGIAIVLPTTAVFVLGALAMPNLTAEAEIGPILSMVAGGLVIFLVGLWDDVRNLSPWTKLALQSVVAAAVFAGGIRIEVLSIGGLGDTGLLPMWLSLVLTVVWIVGTTNAFNLIDGSDGVAAGAALFACASLAFIFGVNADALGALMAITLAGAALGFLVFNFPPATIFMGDSGSLFLGFILATLGVITTHKSSTVVAIAIPVVAFGLPLLDTIMVVARRFLRREPIFKGDRGHIHHRLRELGHSPRQIAIVTYVACAAFAALSLILTASTDMAVVPLFLVAGAILLIAVGRLRVPELVELQRVFERGFRQRHVIAQNVRIREAIGKLDDCRDAAGMVLAIRHAFGSGGFDRVQVWLPSVLGNTFVRSGVRIDHDDDGFRWTWDVNPFQIGENLIEVRLAIRGADRTPIGRLSLYHNGGGDPIITDVRLLATEFEPALRDALHRVAGPTRLAPAGPTVYRAGSVPEILTLGSARDMHSGERVASD